MVTKFLHINLSKFVLAVQVNRGIGLGQACKGIERYDEGVGQKYFVADAMKIAEPPRRLSNSTMWPGGSLCLKFNFKITKILISLRGLTIVLGWPFLDF